MKKPYLYLYIYICKYIRIRIRIYIYIYIYHETSGSQFGPWKHLQANIMEAVQYLARCKHLQIPEGWDFWITNQQFCVFLCLPAHGKNGQKQVYNRSFSHHFRLFPKCIHNKTTHHEFEWQHLVLYLCSFLKTSFDEKQILGIGDRWTTPSMTSVMFPWKSLKWEIHMVFS